MPKIVLTWLLYLRKSAEKIFVYISKVAGLWSLFISQKSPVCEIGNQKRFHKVKNTIYGGIKRQREKKINMYIQIRSKLEI